MNNVIEFKKDCIMKTMVAEITDISLTHDYKIMDDIIDGYFDISGEYKTTLASMQKEEFMYTIPFSIALSSLIDKTSINLTIKDFNYSVDKDILHLKMALNMDYKEIEIPEEPIPEIDPEFTKEEEMDTVDEVLNSITNLVEEEPVYHNELMIEEEKELSSYTEKNIQIETNTIEDKKEAEESIKNIINNMNDEETYYRYKIYIMREEDTIESIAIKYNVTLDDLREYNNLQNINIGDKIVITCIKVIDEK